MIKDNQHYLKVAIDNKEALLDFAYMFVEKNTDIDLYVKDTKKLKELLTTCKIMLERKQDPSEYYQEIFYIITGDYGSKNEFVCFMNACRVSLANLKKNPNILADLIELYLSNRDISDYTPREWVQALIDRGAQRRSGILGEIKIIQMAVSIGYDVVNNWNDLRKSKKCVVKFSNGAFSIQDIKNELGIELQFQNSKKLLDLIIKSDNQTMFLEAKNINGSGGAQDKQIVELVNIASTKIQDSNIYLGAYLDGQYSNSLLSAQAEQNGTKVEKQKYDLLKGLEENSNNYWFNTQAMKEFLNDF